MSARRVAAIVVPAVVALIACAAATLLALDVPRNAAGMAARSVCSAVFVAGRAIDRVFDDDLRPASAALALVSVEVDASQGTATGRFAGLFERRARHLGERGCVLDAGDDAAYAPAPISAPAPAPASQSVRSGSGQAVHAAPWPEGNLPLDPAQWDAHVDAVRLRAVVDAAFVGAGNPQAANTRAVAVVHRGRLLVNRVAPGFSLETPWHGWSMTKTVVAMLAHKREGVGALDGKARVVDAVAGPREPAWAREWRGDARASIRVDDLLWMRDGLANDESYAPWGAVPRMLFGSADIAGHAAAAMAQAPAATRWRYSSGTSNILAQVLRARFDDDAAYWAYPRTALFAPIGAHGAVLETDAAGTWIASSYLWASVGDWARLGQLLLDDGRWPPAAGPLRQAQDGPLRPARDRLGQGDRSREVLPPGFLARASTPAMPNGDGHGYGAHTWRIGSNEGGGCNPSQVPADTIAMRGHWGQIVAIVPSRHAVVVRLGWTFERERFDACGLVADVLAALDAAGPR